MADNNPFSVRMDPEEKEKLLALIAQSGASSKDFMSLLVGAYELNEVKLCTPELAADIGHLEALTSQICSIYVGMGRRIKDVGQAQEAQFEKDLELFKAKIDDLKEKNTGLAAEKEILTAKNAEISEKNAELTKNEVNLDEIIVANRALIQEYKEKNDTLTGLLGQYQGFKVENDTLTASLASEKSAKATLERQVIDQKLEIETLKSQKIEEIARLREKNELESERILLTQSKKSAEKEQQLLTQIQGIREKSFQEIAAYQKKYKELLEKIESEAKPKTTVLAKKSPKDLADKEL